MSGLLEALELAGCGRVSLRGLELPVSIGIHARERQTPQRMRIDVEIWTAPPAGSLPDDIAAVVDYDYLRDGIHALAGGRHFELQETLARAILDHACAPPGVLAARVSTAKPDVYPDCDAVGLSFTRWTAKARRLLDEAAKPDAGDP